MLSKIILLTLATLRLTWAGPPAVPGFSLTWSDEFTGTASSLPNPAEWIVDIGHSYPGGPDNWGTGEIQAYTDRPENLKLTGDGNLQITPLRNANEEWTSARIETKRSDFQARAGGKLRVSARIQMPDVTGDAAAGYWPAFWSLGDKFRGSMAWPAVGEYDIMENVNGLNRVWGVLHCGVAPGGPCNEMIGKGNYLECPGSPCQGNFHIYGVEVDRSSKPEKLTWSVDGKDYHTVTETDIGAGTWKDVVDHGQFLLINVAMGGAFPDGIRGSRTPIPQTVPGKSLLADWIAVYNSV
ncbi:similar to endo-beta-1,3-glucanase [Plenodomus lingam JN3]|uniref:Similar to endo-beta-1,3-glucanase n=2 Tax=Leptosphaeria maculans TaxID=5022 RepID=E5AED9_LEPMJ|nr:similar to endo-beta-1,3-glucanase [Plenodomus lingam JN3]CBY01578.1 similar to endo-beta-1,3-glucanase [Plenodomus lingam JN3]